MHTLIVKTLELKEKSAGYMYVRVRGFSVLYCKPTTGG